MNRVIICILSILIISVINAEGQDVSVKAEFDTSRIYIGDQTYFSIIVEQPSGTKVSIPVFKDTLNNKIEILAGPVIDSSVISGNRIRINNRYLVTSFDSGMFFVKPVYAELQNAGGIKRFYSKYSILEVARVKLSPPDTASKIFDIIGPYKAPLTLGEILPWLLILLAAGLVVWLIIRFAPRLRKVPKQVELPAIIEPAHIIAFRELERLRQEELWQRGESKMYYTRLTEILRQYLENRFNVFSLELTTSETLEALVRTGFKKDENYSILKSVLNGADLVKFAKYKPEPAENEASFKNAWDFVNATRKEESESEQVNTTEKSREAEK